MCHSGIPSNASRSGRAASSRASLSAFSASARSAAAYEPRPPAESGLHSDGRFQFDHALPLLIFGLCLCEFSGVGFLRCKYFGGVLPLGLSFCAFSKSLAFLLDHCVSNFFWLWPHRPLKDSTRASQPISGLSACSKIGSFSRCEEYIKGTILMDNWRSKYDFFLILDAIIYIDVSGCQWRLLPAEYPKRQTV